MTGASAGIGETFAERLAARGYDLVLVARRGGLLQRLAARLRAEHGIAVEVLPIDLADQVAREAVERRLCAADPPIDLLVNNAGVAASGDFAEIAYDELRHQLELNVTSVLRLTRAAVAGMVRRGRGGIVNVSSVAGFLPGRGSTYTASKAWVISFTAGLAEALRGSGVSIVAVCPGYTLTERNKRLRAELAPRSPDVLWLRPERIVDDCLADLDRGRVISVPGMQYRSLLAIVGLLPRSLVRWIAFRGDKTFT